MSANHTRILARAVVCLAAAAIAASACASSAQLRSSGTGTASPTASATPSAPPSATPPATRMVTPTPATTTSPTPVPLSTATTSTPGATVAPTNEWKSIAWSKAAKPRLPWDHLPKQIVQWKGRFLAVDTHGSGSGDVIVADSPDFIHWTVLAKGSAAPARTAKVRRVIVDSARLVVFGLTGGDECGAADDYYFEVFLGHCQVSGAWESSDGAAWRPLALEGLSGVEIRSIARGPNGWVAVGSAGWQKPLVFVSSDAATWERVDLSSTVFRRANLDSVQRTLTGYLAFGDVDSVDPSTVENSPVAGPAAAWWSHDGRTWKAAIVASRAGSHLNVAYEGSEGFLLLGGYGAADVDMIGVWHSTDARRWNFVGQPYLLNDPAKPCQIWWTVADGHSIYSYASNCSQTEYNVWVTADGSGWRKLANKSQINQPLSGPRIYPVPDGFVLVSGFWEGEPLVVHGVGIR